MPRRNNTPKHTPYAPSVSEQAKTRYRSKADAERAAEDLMRYDLNLTLRAYQSPTDGGWYLTRQLAR